MNSQWESVCCFLNSVDKAEEIRSVGMSAGVICATARWANNDFECLLALIDGGHWLLFPSDAYDYAGDSG